MGMIDSALKEHVRLLEIINEKDAEIAELRDSAKLVIEAIERYCPPELQESADNWLKSKGIR